jgi:hypothetical protein
MARKLRHTSVWNLLKVMLLSCTLLYPAMGQSTPAQRQRPPRSLTPPRPLSLAHLYWHFLFYQNHLDTKAAVLDSQGKKGSLMRNHLQQKLGLSDADFALIRTSSVRLTAEVKALDAQAVAIRAAGPSSSSFDQLKALTGQRETDINAEISYLKQNLPPRKIKEFEVFLTQFFSPTNAVPRPSFATVQPAPAAVQK